MRGKVRLWSMIEAARLLASLAIPHSSLSVLQGGA